ncbi:uncharacterized protein LOC131430472 [Malaya genurostris]|uniref:uncharacterized protein LOC131430472 n=1 Tax=Malaya genurostris TaxID=325434 RepID=UPI0026F3B296|nr:uncharacterized protein LOC131430472 [Malaya genurostris]
MTLNVTERSYYYIHTTDGEFEIRDKKSIKSKLILQSPHPTGPNPRVTGFTFPISEQEEVERLENNVSQNALIRQEYINLLSRKKPEGMSIVQFLPLIFSDEALDGYNYNGSNTLGKCKLPMKGYDIFSHCFIDAFSSEGLNLNELATQMAAAIKQSRNRMRQRTFRAKKSIQKMLEIKPCVE